MSYCDYTMHGRHNYYVRSSRLSARFCPGVPTAASEWQWGMTAPPSYEGGRPRGGRGAGPRLRRSGPGR